MGRQPPKQAIWGIFWSQKFLGTGVLRQWLDRTNLKSLTISSIAKDSLEFLHKLISLFCPRPFTISLTLYQRHERRNVSTVSLHCFLLLLGYFVLARLAERQLVNSSVTKVGYQEV